MTYIVRASVRRQAGHLSHGVGSRLSAGPAEAGHKRCWCCREALLLVLLCSEGAIWDR